MVTMSRSSDAQDSTLLYERPADELDQLVDRSNRLASDRALVNFGGGNTSVKVVERDHVGRNVEVLWVKGSGSDLATINRSGFTGLRLEEIRPLSARDEMSDEEMVAYLARCQLAPTMPRPSIETLLHAFVPHSHVDHTHPDAIGAIVGAVDGEQRALECFGDHAIWIPYLRPGFALSKCVAAAVASRPAARLVLLAKHGLVTWGSTSDESYAATIEAVSRASAFVRGWHPRTVAFGGVDGEHASDKERAELLSKVLPTLRGALSVDGPRILQVDASPAVLEFVCSAQAAAISQVGAACPDHLVHTKRRPVWVEFDDGGEDAETLRRRLIEAVADFQEHERAYFKTFASEGDMLLDPSPRIVLIQGVGLVAVGRTLKAARLARDLYLRAIEVMRGASALGGFISLTDEESFAVEYWPLELYKLSLAPPPRELRGMIAIVTGGAGGIGSAIARSIASEDGCVVIADLAAERANEVVAGLGEFAHAVVTDVTSEDSVVAAFREAVLAYGGVDIVVSNAGIASSAPIEKTTLADWERTHAILTRGYFLVSREAARVLREQGRGGSIVFIGSKNAVAASKSASAYSSAKAAELQLARCLAEELGADGIRVNSVNPDAVLEGSQIWNSSWREERARTYGIDPDELEQFYRGRTTLRQNVVPADIAAAVLFLVSSRAAKSTGNIINVDGGVAIAYPR